MSQQTINVGAAPNDGTGTPLRTAFQYTNANFTELYTAVGPSGNNIVVPGNATITGDLTVATSGLKVDSLTGRIAINTATFATGAIGVIQSSATRWAGFNFNNSAGTLGGSIGLDASGSGGGSQDLTVSAVGTNLSLYSGNNLQFKIAHPGVFTWYDGAGGTRMTLNSTGLGVGASPGYKFHVGGYSSANIAPDAALVRSSSGTTIQSGPNLLFSDGTSVNNVVLQNTQGRFGIWNYGAGVWNERLSVDANGNCGIGVAPSAWGSPFKALQVSRAGLRGSTATTGLSFNTYSDGTNLRYIAAGLTALDYYQNSGSHVWQIAGVGANANDPITFTQAMTLDASGNLLVGTTSGSFRGQFAVASGADRNVFTAQVTGASNGFQVLWNHATTTTRVIIANIPTSSAGLAAGTLWNDAGTIKIA